jgi:surface carbohydrate biosynthesis protein
MASAKKPAAIEMKIALVVDNPYRDLPGLVLLAARLCRDGATCFLVPMNQSEEFWMLAPDAVVLNYLRVNNQATAQRLLELGIKVSVLDTEGGVLASTQHYAKTLAPDRSVYRRLSSYFSWGPKLADYLEAEGIYTRDQIAVTGSPRSDFYAPAWRQAALDASAHIEKYPRPLVLVNGNFPVANPRFQTAEEEAKMLVESFSFDPDVVVKWQSTAQRAMYELSALCNSLAAKFPEVTFVYRPHPFERSETYSDLLDDLPNLHLVKAGTVDGWILRSSAVVQRACSTAIEAAIAGVPAISPAWIPTAIPMPTAEAVSVAYETEEALVCALKSILAGSFQWPAAPRRALDEVISDWFYKVDGRAHERVASRLLDMANAGNGEVLEKCRNLVYATNSDSSWHKTRARVLVKLNLPVYFSLRRSLNPFARAADGSRVDASWTRGSEKYFDAADVRVLADAIEPYLGSESSAGRGKIRVQSSQERGDYHFGYRHGNAVTVFSE